MFTKGFEKIAVSLPLIAGISGAGIGAILGEKYGYRLGKKKSEAESIPFFKDRSNDVDAKSYFETIKHKLPKGTLLLTKSELEELSRKEGPYKRFYRAQVRHLDNNAIAISKDERNKHTLPPELKNKYAILSPDKVNEGILLHEAGHLVDFADTAKKSTLGKLYDKHLRSDISLESAAWDKAPLKNDAAEKAKKVGLGSYQKRLFYPLGYSLAGAALAGLGGYALTKSIIKK